MDSGQSLQSSSSAEGECNSRSTNHKQQLLHPPFNHHNYQQQPQFNNPNYPSSQQHQLPNLWSQTLPSFSDHQQLLPSSSHPLSFTAPATGLKDPVSTPRNPKKRSRASRKAPTTVLTTDTSNFRAMVQEFTGVPTSPFATSFDLFGRPSSSTKMRSNINNFDNLPQQPSYLLGPHKLQSSSSSSSSFLDSCYLLNTMQNPTSFSANSFNQTPFLEPKTTEDLGFLNRFGGMGQTQIDEHGTTLHDLVNIQQSTPNGEK